MPVLESREISKEVSSPEGLLTIVDSVSFSVEAGESVAIIGPSGSGKSTLLALLAGLDVPSRGEVRFDGGAFSTLDEDGRARARAGRVGFVFQNFHLVADMTAEENVRMPLDIARTGDASRRARVALEEVGLAARARHEARLLSGGEQQRVALARAFVTRPALLFADEPTGNLDTHNGERVTDLLFELNRQHGTTLVLVTHDPDLARRCGRTLELVAGRVQAERAR